jgi:hypothetical protein
MYKKLFIPLLALFLNISFFNVYGQGSVNETFYTLKEKCRTSAGVYKSDGTLVRTLWSGVVKDPGTYEVKWDGTDDFNKPLPVDNYNIKVLSNNVEYTWQGTVGNSSASQVGNSIHRALEQSDNIIIVGANAYYTVGYNEAQSSHFQFSLDNPQVSLNTFPQYKGQTTTYACTDGINIYWTAWDNYEDAYSWVYATKVSDNSPTTFSNGVRFRAKYGNDYASVLDLKSAHTKPSGIAVSDNYLYVSYKDLGSISVLDKKSGALVRTIPITAPSAMAADGSTIWITSATNTLRKFIINSDGSLNNSSISIAGLSSPVDVRINGNTLAVVDGGTSQQVKAYDINSGLSKWILGQPGGNKTSPLVTNDKFAFWLLRDGTGQKEPRGGIAFAQDGSFWVSDPSNNRMQHYDANRNFIERIFYMGKTRTCHVDPNNSKRVFANGYEFEVDYTSPIKNAWIPKYNWEGKIDGGYAVQEYIKYVTTLSNGKTYAMMIRDPGTASEIVELDPATGIRFTGVVATPMTNVKLYADGSLYSVGGIAVNETAEWFKRTLVGFDASNNPIYTNPVKVLSHSVTDINQPILTGPRLLPFEATSSGVLANFKAVREANEDGSYHLGGLNITTGKWLWKTSLSTFKEYKGDFPDNGDYDIGNGVNEYAGSVATTLEKNIFWGYNGEFWKGGQVNKWNQYYDNGLFVGQFGVVGGDYLLDPNTYPGMAGNAFCPSIVKVGEDYYFYHNDESVHGGISRWKITGLNSIKEQTLDIKTSFVRSGEETLLPGVDLMAGLPYRNVLTNNTAGWTRTPANDNAEWSVKTNVQTYGKTKSPDLYLVYSSMTNTNAINRELGSNFNLPTWGITGRISYNGTNPNYWDGTATNAFYDILDNTGKIIVRIYQVSDVPHANTIFKVNNTPIFSKGTIDMQQFTKDYKDLTVNKTGSTITVSFAGMSATVTEAYDAGANMSNPTTMRMYFTNPTATGDAKAIGLDRFRFFQSNTNSFTTPASPTLQGDDIANTLVASHELGNSEILVSENDASYKPYLGQINVGDVVRPAGFWKFKTKGASQRNESSVINSPAFTSGGTENCSATGTILYERWSNVGGSHISDQIWNRTPNNTLEINSIDAPRNVGDVYAARISGYVCAPQTGNYTFWISGDDATELWLSPDDNPNNKSRIAYNDEWSNMRWTTYASQKSKQIYLIAGHKYYIEALLKENYGDDNLTVAWELPNGKMEAPIPGSSLSPYKYSLNNNIREQAVTTNCSASGNISYEVWNSIYGQKLSNTDWSKTPISKSDISSLEAPKNAGDAYVARIRGYICPPKSGNYTFWISGDDATELWLSTNSDPANKSKIAYNETWSGGVRTWDRYPSQKSVQIYLTEGNKYYIEALLREDYGDDNLAVAWQLPDGNMEAPIPGSRLSPYNTESSLELRSFVQVNNNVAMDEVAVKTEQSKQGSISVFPNPIISNTVNIQANTYTAGQYTITVLNNLGQLVYKKLLTHPGGPLKHTIFLSNSLAKGLYLLNVAGKETVFTKKLVK